MQYLNHTKTTGLTYGGEIGKGITDFYGTCDAAHNATWDSRGITGWAYQLNGAAISWHCRAQREIVALSSTEAELIAVDSAVRELRFLHKLLGEFGEQTGTKPTVIGQDNMSTLKLCDSTHFNPRTKHVALRYHHVGSQQRAGVVRLKYMSTDQIPSDLLTKPLPTEAHRRHTATLMGTRRPAWPKDNEQAKFLVEHSSSGIQIDTAILEGV